MELSSPELSRIDLSKRAAERVERDGQDGEENEGQKEQERPRRPRALYSLDLV